MDERPVSAPVYHIQTGDYEWSDWAVYEHPMTPGMRMYFVWTENGCSCSGWEGPEFKDAEAATPMTRFQVLKDFSAWWDDRGYDDDPQGKARRAEKLIAALNKR